MNTTMQNVASLTARRVREAVQEAVATFDVPAVQVAWRCDGETGQAGTVSAETRFPIGSIAKAFTASLAVQLVGDEALSLDGPIGPMLPAGRCREVLGDITVRQLLTHTSGLENDHADLGEAASSPREYVRACVREPLFPPGEAFSYANAGFVVAGHLVEESSGETWADQLQAFLLEPLEVRNALFLSDPLRPGAVAQGHVRRPDGELAPMPRRVLPRQWAPVGGLALTARGLLALAQLHLDGGRTPLGYPLLDPALVGEMREPHAVVPGSDFADAWGLGWALYHDAAGGRWFGHDGEDEGWTARVRANADSGFAIVMLASCLPGRAEWRRLLAALASAGVPVGEPVAPEPAEPQPPVDPELAGVYANGSMRLVVDREETGLWMTTAAGDRVSLRAVDRDRCLATPAGAGETPYVVAFLRDGDGRVRYLHAGGRIARRTA